MLEDAVEVSREELYEQVWSEPVMKLAQKYGVTGTGLAKICRGAEIPLPAPGYWQKIQYGHNVPRPRLPSVDNGSNATITIARTPPKPTLTPEAEASVAREKDDVNEIRVADRLARPHPLVRAAAEALKGQSADTFGRLHRPRLVKCLDIRVSRTALSRALRIMDALLKAAEARGFKVGVADGEWGSTFIQVLGETVDLLLEEKTARKDHVLTKDERDRKAKYGWSSAPRWDYEPSTVLQVRLDEVWGRGTRKTWTDTQRHQIEECLNDVLAGVVVLAEAKRAERARIERQREEWAEAQRLKAREEERRRAKAARLQALEAKAESWAKSRQIFAYADAVEREAVERAMAVTEGSPVHAWLMWARTYATTLNPVRTVATALAEASESDPGALERAVTESPRKC